jgi:hypothetical protein
VAQLVGAKSPKVCQCARKAGHLIAVIWGTAASFGHEMASYLPLRSIFWRYNGQNLPPCFPIWLSSSCCSYSRSKAVRLRKMMSVEYSA